MTAGSQWAGVRMMRTVLMDLETGQLPLLQPDQVCQNSELCFLFQYIHSLHYLYFVRFTQNTEKHE